MEPERAIAAMLGSLKLELSHKPNLNSTEVVAILAAATPEITKHYLRGQ